MLVFTLSKPMPSDIFPPASLHKSHHQLGFPSVQIPEGMGTLAFKPPHLRRGREGMVEELSSQLQDLVVEAVQARADQETGSETGRGRRGYY